MTSLEKVNEMLEKDPELLEKLQSETRRLTDSGKKTSVKSQLKRSKRPSA